MNVNVFIDGPATPPRRNGELAFDAPWQSRVFALAAGVVENRFGGDWEPFRRRLIAAIAAEPDRPTGIAGRRPWRTWSSPPGSWLRARWTNGSPAERLIQSDVPSARIVSQ
jgi:hypothetical protein